MVRLGGFADDIAGGADARLYYVPVCSRHGLSLADAINPQGVIAPPHMASEGILDLIRKFM
jgi:hypothetical protein